ncbi:hypothetical protein NPIL_277631 [Nephila pilipes]|uniref:Uncharacterized protein n=1 Tax=Nephila pilipes TaxID=299642 RepID=A0A8X6P7M0_NEPPI|nr:hypothetical protein NPIL_277631 [Nephila pilipes]
MKDDDARPSSGKEVPSKLGCIREMNCSEMRGPLSPELFTARGFQIQRSDQGNGVHNWLVKGGIWSGVAMFSGEGGGVQGELSYWLSRLQCKEKVFEREKRKGCPQSGHPPVL